MTVAGKTIADPFKQLTEYAHRYSGTLTKYDLGGSGDANVLTADEVTRTRIIASRISATESAWFVERGRSAPWSQVAADASLASADPAEPDGLYAAAIALYDHFREAAPKGVATAKIHKVLHLKRPALIPILDSRLLAAYGPAAAEAARRHPDLGARRLNWVAIREDLIDESNARALTEVRARLAADEDATVRVMARLTDLRLLDAVAWRAG
ncbi:hypothetical protein I598_2420 [Isoptericola dokdonensis DS-3]|uniref:Uncharacterized protein n=2 Tax=Isoptericola TaxID=254250 RepID=A0A161IEY9_9MICO|nr:hypothetical protein I598_2420 [Isoptericola dokdonensis DS-3]